MTASSRRRRFLPALAAAFALALSSALVTAAPAAAHDVLLSSDPEPDAQLEQLPEVLTLTFNAEPLNEPGGNVVQVTDATGAALSQGPVELDGVNVVQPLSGTASGEISVLWRVVSSDGHPISGEFTFTVTGAPPADTPTPTATAEESPTAPASPTASPTEAPDPADPADQADASPLPWIILAVVVVAGLAVLAYVLGSRRRRAGRDGGSGATTER